MEEGQDTIQVRSEFDKLLLASSAFVMNVLTHTDVLYGMTQRGDIPEEVRAELGSVINGLMKGAELFSDDLVRRRNGEL
ncbi:hypothetical protein B0T40_10535 [Chromobacterium haemolyticum]|uniref:hypothetical protein n=1 Tax=Chromobacterium haemolyticum TaxID=394935 RepID=UPI0009D972E5|nr:hypothetical protein [Chromobacterium haemolyticum]OQS36814.1 hypothetical protein B0T40_10535 [Chromobacterium haemolyticum]